MKNFYKNIVALLALLALSFIGGALQRLLNGTLLALLALSFLVCATCAKFVPLKNSPKPLLLLNCANYATCATYKIRI